MLEKMFDESYNIRDVLDKLVEGVALREKLILTAKQFAEKKREERFVHAVTQFENLMTDFLRLWQPVLDRIRAYRENTQKEISTLMSSFMTLNGMLEISRGVQLFPDRVERLQAESQELDNNIKEKTKTVEKIDDLLRRIKPYHLSPADSSLKEPSADILTGMSKVLEFDLPETRKEVISPRKSSARS